MISFAKFRPKASFIAAALLASSASYAAVPTLDDVTDFAVNEDTASTPFSLTGFSGDAGQTYRLTLAVDSGTLTITPATGSGITLAGDGTNNITIDANDTDLATFLGAATVAFQDAANASGAVTMTVDLTETGILAPAIPEAMAQQSTAITVNPVDDAPTITGLGTDYTVNEDSNDPIDLSAVSFADVEDDSLTVTLSVDAGTLQVQASGAITAGASGSSVTLTGVAADINTYLDTTSNVTYQGASNANGNDAALLTVAASGLVAMTTVTANIDITAAPDATTISATPADVSIAGAGSGDVDLSAVSFGDADNPPSVDIVISTSAGNLSASPGGGVTVQNSGSAAITLQGSIAAINSFIASASAIQLDLGMASSATLEVRESGNLLASFNASRAPAAAPATAVPTLGHFGVAALAAMLGFVGLRRRRQL